MEPSGELDLAIVGGGVAGTYAAWRLSESGICPPDRIAVFEAAEQAGGRLRSLQRPGPDDFVAEAGGGAFHRTHRHLHRLVDRLGLATRDHPIGSRRSLLNLRGTTTVYRKLRYKVARPFPYAVSRRTQIRGFAALWRKAVGRILPNVVDFESEDWTQAVFTANFMGRPLRDWPLYAALLRVLEPEEVRFLEAASGYAIFVHAPNAAAGLAWNIRELAAAGGMTALVDGYQRLPLALAQRAGECGGSVRLRHRLVAIERRSETFTLRFERDSTGEMEVVKARQVILALPPAAMAAVPGVAALIGDRMLEAATPWPMSTIALFYPSAWWAAIGIERGRSITDLPARQIWHFGGSESRAGLISSHSDGGDAAFWRDLAPSGDPPLQGLSAIAPESDIAQELHRQIGSIYGPFLRHDIPQPQAGWFQDWGAPAYGGAFHVWARGVDPASARNAAMQPVSDLPLYLCGEAWSDRHGWVEGALEQTETVLQKHFGVRPPAWLS